VPDALLQYRSGRLRVYKWIHAMESSREVLWLIDTWAGQINFIMV